MSDYKELYRRMKNVAAGYSNFCEESGSTRRLDKEYEAIEQDARAAALASPPPQSAPQEAQPNLAQQLADARELADSEGTRAVEYLRRARKAEAALKASQSAAVSKPYAWHYWNSGGASVYHRGPSKALDADLEAADKFPQTHHVVPLYTSASIERAQDAAEPATEEDRAVYGSIAANYFKDAPQGAGKVEPVAWIHPLMLQHLREGTRDSTQVHAKQELSKELPLYLRPTQRALSDMDIRMVYSKFGVRCEDIDVQIARAILADAGPQSTTAEQALEAIFAVVQKYLPPDGTPLKEAMSEIIAILDTPAPKEQK